jgi:hypothetical protein
MQKGKLGKSGSLPWSFGLRNIAIVAEMKGMVSCQPKFKRQGKSEKAKEAINIERKMKCREATSQNSSPHIKETAFQF